MNKLKKVLKKDKVRILLISSLLAVIILLFKQQTRFIHNVSDFFCIIGLIHIVLGSTRYINNVGLFKSFSYMAYRYRWKGNKNISSELHPLSLAEYTQTVIMDETRHKPVLSILSIGLCYCLISIALVM